MEIEQKFAELLGLGQEWRMTGVQFDEATRTFRLQVAETPELWPAESARQGSSVHCYDHVPQLSWRHLNM